MLIRIKRNLLILKNKLMKKTGKCRLCGKMKKLSFEHVQPESAYNSNPVFFQDYENLHDKSSYVYGKRKQSLRGAGGMYL